MTQLINTKIAGVTFPNEDGTNRQDLIKQLKIEEELILEKEDNNPYDSNALRILNKNKQMIGYIKKTLAQDIRTGMKNGWVYKAKVSMITGQDKQTTGCNIVIEATKESE